MPRDFLIYTISPDVSKKYVGAHLVNLLLNFEIENHKIKVQYME